MGFIFKLNNIEKMQPGAKITFGSFDFVVD
jgi:hypothetical protein